MKYVICLLFFLSLPFSSYTQQPPFSLYFSNPVFFNPAQTGNMNSLFRLHTLYKQQWVNLSHNYIFSWTSFEYNIAKVNSGVGVSFFNQSVLELGIQANELGFYYAYHAKINKQWKLSFALSSFYTNQQWDISRLLFSDQIENNRLTTAESFEKFRDTQVTFSFGTLLQGKNFWYGITFKDVNKYEISDRGEKQAYPLYFSMQAGYQWKFDALMSLRLFLLYHQQNSFKEAQTGFQFFYQPIFIGLNYKFLPAPTGNSYAFVLDIGIAFKDFIISYGYDLNYGSLLPLGASHELVLHINLGKKGVKKRRMKR